MDQGQACTEGAARHYPPACYAWFVVAILLLFGIVSHLDRYIIALLVEPLKSDLGLTDTQASLLQGTSFAAFFVLFSMPAGMLVDRTNRPLILAGAIVSWSLASALGGLASGFWGLFASRAAVGMSEAFLAPAAFSLIADYFPLSRRGRAMSLYNMANYLGGGASMLVGGLVYGALTSGALAIPALAGRQPWQATLLVVGLPGAALALLMLGVRDPLRGASRRSVSTVPNEGFLHHMRDAPWVYAAVHGVSAATAFTGLAVVSWLPSYFARTFDLTPAVAGPMIGPVSAVGGVLGCVLSGVCSDWSINRNRTGGRFLLPLAWWPTALAGLLLLTLAATPDLALAGVFVFTLGSGFGLASVAPSIQDITPARFRGQAAALHFVLAGLLGFGSAPTLVALINDRVFRSPDALGRSMLVLLVPVIIAGFVTCLLARKAYDRRRLVFI